MKRILVIGMTGGIGGVETFISNLLMKYDKNKFKIDLLLYQDANKKYKEILKKADNVYYVHSIKKNPLKYLIDIVKFYRKHEYDIIHLNECTSKLFVYCWPVTFLKHTKLIVHSHNGGGSSFFHSILKGWQNHEADQFWSCSAKASKWMFGKYNSQGTKKIKLIKNGVDVERYLYSSLVRNKCRNNLNIEDSTVVIGSIARFENQKNHTFILDIFNDYLRRNDNSLLVLVGDGSLKKYIMNKASDLGISKKILFLGNRDDIYELVQSFDVLLMPSLYEGLPFVGLEAQAASLPIIASNTVDESLKITRYIQFLDLNSELSEWSDAIDNSIKMFSSKRSKSTDYVREKFLESHYDLNETINRIEKLYCKL